MAQVKLSPPWAIYYEKVKALFEKDKLVRVYFNENEKNLSLLVEDKRKAEALEFLLPSTIEFGNVTLNISVIPSNNATGHSICVSRYEMNQLFEIAFCENEAFKYAETISGITSNPITFVVFEKSVVQYYNDDLSDIHGVCSTLYQELAKEVFVDLDGVYFNTDTEEKKESINTYSITSLPTAISSTCSRC